MRFRNTTIVLLGMVLLGACSNEVIFTGEYSPQLVLNSVSEANKAIKMTLNRDVPFLDTLINDYDLRDRYSVDDALVLLYENDVLVDTMRNGSYKSEYVSDVVAKENHKYTIQASHPNYPTVKASTVIPQAVPIKALNYALNADSSWMRLRITLSDPSSDLNFYSLQMYRLRNEKFKASLRLYNTDPVFSKVPEFDFNSLSVNDEYATGESSIMFSDEYVTTNDLTIQADIRLTFDELKDIYPNGNPNDIKLNDTLVVELSALHPDIYKYNKTMEMYDKTQTSNLEPINAYSNVENGVGLVSGVSAVQLVFYYK